MDTEKKVQSTNNIYRKKYLKNKTKVQSTDNIFSETTFVEDIFCFYIIGALHLKIILYELSTKITATLLLQKKTYQHLIVN